MTLTQIKVTTEELDIAKENHERNIQKYLVEEEYDETIEDLDQATLLIREIVAPFNIEGKKYLAEDQQNLITEIAKCIRNGKITEGKNILSIKIKSHFLPQEMRYQLYYLLGVIYQQAGKTNFAIDNYQNALNNLNEDNPYPRYASSSYAGLADINLRNLGDLAKALEYAEKANSCNDDIATPYVLKLKILAAKNNEQDFLTTLEKCKVKLMNLRREDAIEFVGILLERFDNDPFLVEFYKFSCYEKCKNILHDIRMEFVKGKLANV